MRYLARILKTHFREDFDLVSVIIVFLLCSGISVLHYHFHLVKEQIMIYPHLQRIPLYWVLFFSVFISACLVLYFRKQIPNIFIIPGFWFFAALAMLINAFDQSYYLLSLVKNRVFESDAVRSAAVSLATHSVSVVSVIIPLVICHFIWNKDRRSFYGLRLDHSAKLKPYFLVLAIMLVLVSVACLSSGMGSYYPVYQRSGLVKNAGELGLSEPAAIAIFETVYASDFLAVELFFRGFLVFAFGRYMGKQVVLPMAACYMIFHFGKPVLETVSSFFGGYLLGILSWQTRNIWGGIILHIGTALFMEAIAAACK